MITARPGPVRCACARLSRSDCPPPAFLPLPRPPEGVHSLRGPGLRMGRTRGGGWGGGGELRRHLAPFGSPCCASQGDPCAPACMLAVATRSWTRGTLTRVPRSPRRQLPADSVSTALLRCPVVRGGANPSTPSCSQDVVKGIRNNKDDPSAYISTGETTPLPHLFGSS